VNLPLATEPIATEADVELKVIGPLLTGGAYLAIPRASVKGKSYLAPAPLDKSAGRVGGYFPDFSVWELGFCHFDSRSKSSRSSRRGRVPRRMPAARHLNADYKSGLNPCHFVLASNGKQLA
jgi:hypothetical protein